MTIYKLRVVILSFWGVSFLIAVLMVFLAPLLRSDHKIGFDQVDEIIFQIAGVWIPPLTCFSTFWFADPTIKTSKQKKAGSDRTQVAIGFTVTFLLLLLVSIGVQLYLVDYVPNALGDIEAGQSVLERLNGVTKTALLLSPLALAPISWSTSVTPSTPAARSTRGTTPPAGTATEGSSDTA